MAVSLIALLAPFLAAIILAVFLGIGGFITILQHGQLIAIIGGIIIAAYVVLKIFK